MHWRWHVCLFLAGAPAGACMEVLFKESPANAYEPAGVLTFWNWSNKQPAPSSFDVPSFCPKA